MHFEDLWLSACKTHAVCPLRPWRPHHIHIAPCILLAPQTVNTKFFSTRTNGLFDWKTLPEKLHLPLCLLHQNVFTLIPELDSTPYPLPHNPPSPTTIIHLWMWAHTTEHGLVCTDMHVNVHMHSHIPPCCGSRKTLHYECRRWGWQSQSDTLTSNSLWCYIGL